MQMFNIPIAFQNVGSQSDMWINSLLTRFIFLKSGLQIAATPLVPPSHGESFC